jgi:hypothetical protein
MINSFKSTQYRSNISRKLFMSLYIVNFKWLQKSGFL